MSIIFLAMLVKSIYTGSLFLSIALSVAFVVSSRSCSVAIQNDEQEEKYEREIIDYDLLDV